MIIFSRSDQKFKIAAFLGKRYLSRANLPSRGENIRSSIMAATELSLEKIYEYFVQNGGLVSNRDVVRHFRRYLTDPASKGTYVFCGISKLIPVKRFVYVRFFSNYL